MQIKAMLVDQKKVEEVLKMVEGDSVLREKMNLLGFDLFEAYAILDTGKLFDNMRPEIQVVVSDLIGAKLGRFSTHCITVILNYLMKMNADPEMARKFLSVLDKGLDVIEGELKQLFKD